jgi:beta-glucosidase
VWQQKFEAEARIWHSEDPFLAARMTTAVVRGLQGDGQLDLQREDKLIAVLKHFCAQGACVGGHNTGPASIGQRELNEIHLPGMKAGVAAGALACMAAYNEIDGLPCNADPYLLTEVLRNQWGFRGIVMADGGAVDRLLVQAGDHEAAAALALTAGLDLSLWDTAFTTLESAYHHGKITEAAINVAVSRVLRLKLLLGLFDRSYTDESLPSRTIGIERSRQLNLRIAQESIVLLKNQLQILPLKKTINRIAVIGPNADSLYNQLGDYTSNQLPGVGITILEGIRRTVAKTTEIRYAQGCGIRNASKNGFNEAMEAAKDADVIILVIGGCSTRDFDVQFDTNGAAIVSDTVTEMDCGEGVDIADLELGGVQVELAKQLVSTGIPVIVVLIQGRPHAIPWIADHCDAVLCGWYPGQEGGQAIADVLFGDYNPNGKLPVSIPYSTSQLPVHYNYKDIGSSSMNYLDMPGSPLFPFGFGLSYSSFAYSDLRFLSEEINIDALERGERLEISVHVSNVRGRGGAEVVQLYIRDLEASVTRRVQELKGFEKIWLDAGECRVVRLSLGYEELAIWNREMRFLVEPGNVEIQVGGSSMNTLKGRITISR